MIENNKNSIVNDKNSIVNDNLSKGLTVFYWNSLFIMQMEGKNKNTSLYAMCVFENNRKISEL